MSAAGLSKPSELRPWHIMRRISQLEVRHYGEIFEYLAPGALLREPLPASIGRAWEVADASTFAYQEADSSAISIPQTSANGHFAERPHI